MTNNFWNERYADEAYAYGVEPNQFLAENLSFLPAHGPAHGPTHGKVLCLAEGEGRNATYLATQGFSVTAIDFSNAGKAKAERLAKSKDVAIDYHVADLAHFDFGQNCWDAIVSIFAHTPSTLRRSIHDKVKSSLKTNGVFMLEAYAPKHLGYDTGGPKDPDMLVSLDELQTAFAGFDTLHAEELEKTVVEGLFHTGQAYVTQFIVRKP